MGKEQQISRRRMMLLGMGGLSALTSTRQARAAASALTTFQSPPLQPFVDELPYLAPTTPPSSLSLSTGTHRFHRDLPLDQVLGIGGQSYLGPTLEAHRDEALRVSFVNQIQAHPFAADIDTTLMGVSELDKTCPRTAMHLHGGLTEPNSDGHPMASTRRGFARAHRYGNRQEAAGLWYHDHALGLTRLNAFAGLAGQYLLRDDFDTGQASNRLGLPCGEFELPLVLQDRIFSKQDGKVGFRTQTFVKQGQWEGGQFGDVPVVNGKVMPHCKVARGLYRLRLLNASNLRTYLLSLSNGMPLIVIGSDAGLFNTPVSSTNLLIAPGERYDVLVDFSNLAPGDKVLLRNDQRLPLQAQVFGDPIITQVMQFSVQASKGGRYRVPARLRGDWGLPPLLPVPAAPTVVRNMSLLQVLDLGRFPPALMSLNNLPFDTTDVERPRAGTVEQWNIINTTTDDHPVHLHLARLKVLGRQPFNVSAYQLLNHRPTVGMRWAPSADKFVKGSMTPPKAWEAGLKDTVYAPPGTITRVLVQWPTVDAMGFDPDGPIQVPDNVIAGAPATPDKLPGDLTIASAAANAICTTTSSANNGVLRLNPVIQDSATTVRGYVWHCHVLDHEDHDMMLPVRIQTR
jgi:spore coat protein A